MERSCTVNLFGNELHCKNKNKHFHGKELHCKPSYTKTNTLMEKSCTVNLTQNKHFHGNELHCKPSYTKINTFMERSCTVNLLTQKQTFSWKGVAL